MYVDDFVAKLAKLGLMIVTVRDANGDKLGTIEYDTDDPLKWIEEDQRDELQTILDDVNTDGVNSVMFESFDLPDDAADLAEWAKNFESGNYKLDTDNMSGLLELAMDAGRGEAWHDIDTLMLPDPATPMPEEGTVTLDAAEWAKAVLAGVSAPYRVPVSPTLLASWFALAIEAGRQANRVRGLNADDDEAAFDVAEVNTVEFILNGDEGGKVWLNVDGRCRARFGKTSIVIVEQGGNRNVLRRPAEPEVAVEADSGTEASD